MYIEYTSTLSSDRLTLSQTRKGSAIGSGTALAANSRTRSTRSAATAQPFEDDPESILREARRSRRARQSLDAHHRLESSACGLPVGLVRSIESSLTENYRSADSEVDSNYFDNDPTQSWQSTDPEQVFNRTWGYLPPLDEETVALIEAIIANPAMAKESIRIGPENPEFPRGLMHQNVFISESPDADPIAIYIKQINLEESPRESDEERQSHRQLWKLDQIRCKDGSNEALFQRTLMMSLIARHSLIYKTQPDSKRFLDFSVEEVWNSPPMPTRAYTKDAQFLTQPKPDLAVCFCREAVIDNKLWYNMPKATIRLACYEKDTESAGERVFHFFTVEAKKAEMSPDDTVGKRQSLNNASQALHNMFEFFKDAGPKHEEIFFKEVRFFSVVASTEGLTIRIHRATRGRADRSDLGHIMPDRPDYPLRFEYEEFDRVEKRTFDRDTVFDTFERILVGYGVKKLRGLLYDAAEAIMEKLSDDPEGMQEREHRHFYRYEQTVMKPGSRKSATAASKTPSIANRSVDSLQTPTQTRDLTPMQTGSSFGSKRHRTQSEESGLGTHIRRPRKK